MSKKKTGYHGNKNAAKPADERLDVGISFRACAADKELWQQLAEADGKTLAQWIKDHLPEA